MRLESLLDYLPPDDKELALRLFGAFAHAEYVLKQAGFLRRGIESAEADWETYADTISGRFKREKGGQFRDSWTLLVSSPPRKQVVREGRLAWKDVTRPKGLTDEAYGLLMVRRIRNNLFTVPSSWLVDLASINAIVASFRLP